MTEDRTGLGVFVALDEPEARRFAAELAYVLEKDSDLVRDEDGGVTWQWESIRV